MWNLSFEPSRNNAVPKAISSTISFKERGAKNPDTAICTYFLGLTSAELHEQIGHLVSGGYPKKQQPAITCEQLCGFTATTNNTWWVCAIALAFFSPPLAFYGSAKSMSYLPQMLLYIWWSDASWPRKHKHIYWSPIYDWVLTTFLLLYVRNN